MIPELKHITDRKNLENLILQLSAGELGALEKLYQETKTAVYGLALSILRKAQDAEDVMQETYIRVYQGATRYRAKGKPVAWILTITRNLSLDRLRAKSAQELYIEDEWIPDHKNNFTESSVDRLLLGTLLNELPDEERQIIVLHSIAGLKHREIAELLQIPLATSLSKYHRSLSKLRKILKEGEN